MKLKQFLVSESPKVVAETAPTIGFTFVNGRISFNRTTARQLELNEGDHLSFWQDQDSPTDWYMSKTTATTAAITLHTPTHAVPGTMHGACSRLTRAILGPLGIYKSCRFFLSDPITVDGRPVRQILTKHPIISNRHD